MKRILYFVVFYLTNKQVNVAETHNKLEAVWFCHFTACYNSIKFEYQLPTDTNSKFTVSLCVRLSLNSLTLKCLMNSIIKQHWPQRNYSEWSAFFCL